MSSVLRVYDDSMTLIMEYSFEIRESLWLRANPYFGTFCEDLQMPSVNEIIQFAKNYGKYIAFGSHHSLETYLALDRQTGTMGSSNDDSQRTH